MSTASETSLSESTIRESKSTLDDPSATGDSNDVQTSVREILKMGMIPDCGVPPLWLNDTLGNSNGSTNDMDSPSSPKTYRYKLSGEDQAKLQDLSVFLGPLDGDETDGSRNHSSISPTRGLATDHSVAKSPSRAKTSALADAFLEKVQHTWQQDLHKYSTKVPSLRIVKAVKGRWPPQPRKRQGLPITYENAATNEKSSTMRGLHLCSNVSTRELMDAFETGKFRQTTDLSPKAIKEAAYNRAKEGSLLSPVSVKQRQRSFENNDTTPLHRLYQRTNRLSQSDHASTSPSPRAVAAFVQPYDFDDNSTLSSHNAELDSVRSSYKIQYLGEREWGSETADSAFPSMVRRGVNDPEGFAGDSNSAGSNQWLSDKGRFSTLDADVMPSCYYSSELDQRLNNCAKGDYTAGGVPMRDRRFDGSDGLGECMPRIPHRSRDLYIPTIWQTRVSDSVDGDSVKRRWRLKRVWEYSRDNSIVIDEAEADFVVDESDLESALNSLMGIPGGIYIDNHRNNDLTSILTSSESNFSEFSGPELAQNRWDVSCGHNDPLLKKPWRVQRVWDKDGEICWVDDEKTTDGAGLLKVFCSDDNMPRDGLVEDEARYISVDPIMKQLEGDNEQSCTDTNEDVQFFEANSESSEDSLSNCVSIIGDESLDLGDLEANLDQMSVDRTDTDSERSLKMIRRKLRKVESWIEKLQNKRAATKNENDLVIRLQLKCIHQLDEISRLGELKHPRKGKKAQSESGQASMKVSPKINFSADRSITQQTMTSSLESMLGNLKSLDVILEDEDSRGSSQREQRDPALIRRKIRKVEKELQKFNVAKGGEGKTEKPYRKLEEKLSQYKRELTNQPGVRESISGEWMNVRRRVEQAIGVVQATVEESMPNRTVGSTEKHSRIETIPVSSPRRMPSLACQNVGSWSSPLFQASSNDRDDDLKLFIHSLDSVYK